LLVTFSGAAAFTLFYIVVAIVRSIEFKPDLFFFGGVLIAFIYLATTLPKGRGWALVSTAMVMYAISWKWNLDPDHLLGSGYMLFVVAASAVAFENTFRDIHHESGRESESDGAQRARFPSPVSSVLTFVEAKKRYWLVPVVVLGSLFGGLIVLTKGPKVAPFVYTLF